MNRDPLISIIIPVYNSSKYLRRCLDSVLSQDYRNIEILLIDDGSMDDSPLICDEYAALYRNINVYHISNGGASLARKKGLDVARGQFISFVDSDDYVLPNYISFMLAAIRKYNTLVSSCAVHIIYDESLRHDVTLENEEKILLLDKRELFFRFFNYEFWGLWGSLYRREAFDNIIFPRATLSEDYFIKAQMFLRDSRMAYIPSSLYIYEKHDGSLSKTSLSVRAFEEFENVFQVYKMFQKEEQYQSLALKNVVETCIKLLLMGTVQERRAFKNKYKPIHMFLREHCFEIFQNDFLLKKLRFIALSLTFFPTLSRFYNFILK